MARILHELLTKQYHLFSKAIFILFCCLQFGTVFIAAAVAGGGAVAHSLNDGKRDSKNSSNVPLISSGDSACAARSLEQDFIEQDSSCCAQKLSLVREWLDDQARVNLPEPMVEILGGVAMRSSANEDVPQAGKERAREECIFYPMDSKDICLSCCVGPDGVDEAESFLFEVTSRNFLKGLSETQHPFEISSNFGSVVQRDCNFWGLNPAFNLDFLIKVIEYGSVYVRSGFESDQSDISLMVVAHLDNIVGDAQWAVLVFRPRNIAAQRNIAVQEPIIFKDLAAVYVSVEHPAVAKCNGTTDYANLLVPYNNLDFMITDGKISILCDYPKYLRILEKLQTIRGYYNSNDPRFVEEYLKVFPGAIPTNERDVNE